MFVDANDLYGTLGNRDARDDRARRVALQEAFHTAHNLIVRARLFAFVAQEEAPPVVDVLRPVDADGHAEKVSLQKVNYLVDQQSAVGSDRKIDLFAHLGAFVLGILDNLLHQLEVEQCLAAEEDDVNLAILTRLLKQKIYAGSSRFPFHPDWRGSVFGPVRFVTVSAVKVTFVGDVEDQ